MTNFFPTYPHVKTQSGGHFKRKIAQKGAGAAMYEPVIRPRPGRQQYLGNGIIIKKNTSL